MGGEGFSSSPPLFCHCRRPWWYRWRWTQRRKVSRRWSSSSGREATIVIGACTGDSDEGDQESEMCFMCGHQPRDSLRLRSRCIGGVRGSENFCRYNVRPCQPRNAQAADTPMGKRCAKCVTTLEVAILKAPVIWQKKVERGFVATVSGGEITRFVVCSTNEERVGYAIVINTLFPHLLHRVPWCHRAGRSAGEPSLSTSG